MELETRGESEICLWFALQIVAMARAKPGTSPGPHLWVQGPDACAIFAAFPRHISRKVNQK